MGSGQSTDKKGSPSKSDEGSPKKRLGSSSSNGSPAQQPSSPAPEGTPQKTAASPSSAGPSTPPQPDEIIPVSEVDIASIEAAIQDKLTREGGLRYEVILSPAVKKGPKISPPTSPLTEDVLFKKLKDAEERRHSLDTLRMKNLSAQLAKIEIAQQKKEEIITEKSQKIAEALNSKLTSAEESRSAQLQEVKDKLSDHMGKIERAQRELEIQLEAARVAAEASLCEKMEIHKKKRDEEMEEMLKKIQEHQEKVSKVRSNQEVSVTELENNIKEKLDRARLAKEKQDELMMEKLAEQNRKAELVRQNKERLQVQAESNQTNESA